MNRICRRSFRRRSAYASCAALAMAGVLVLAPDAATASTSTSTPAAEDGTVGQITATQEGLGALAGGDITCYFQIDNPHQSTTPGYEDRWNVHAHWDCRYDATNAHARVDTLEIEPDLYRDGVLVGNPAPKRKFNVYSLNHNASAYCNIADWDSIWYGKARGFVRFPPNYEPQTATLRVETDSYLQGLSCGLPGTAR